MKLPPPLDRKLIRELEAQGATEEIARLKRGRTEELDACYPKPDAQAIQGFYERKRSEDAVWNEYIRKAREVRFMHDTLPEKYQKDSKDGRRFYTRLSNNEILRTVSLQCRNDYKVKVPAAGSSETALKQAQKQTRWSQQLRGALERKAGKGLRRIVVDNQHGDSIGAFEIFLTDAYDKLDLGQREDESNRDYLKRTEEDLKRAGMPFGIRPVDKLALFYDEDEDGVCRAVIVERKERDRWLREDRLRKLRKSRIPNTDEDGAPIPDPHVPGAPIDGANNEQTGDTVECVKYYDRRWYAYMVEGKLVECEEHMLPDTPIVLFPGIPTGSPNKSEALQGVTWGLFDIERFLNDSLTREWDLSFTYQNPKLVVETPTDGRLMPGEDPMSTTPAVIDLSKPGVPQLNPGQKMVNVTQGWQPYATDKVQSFALQMWERSGLNPIAQGQSPGSDPAGYTVNSLQGAAQNLYEVLLDNEARGWERVCDFLRLVVRDTLNETVYLSVPMADNKEGGTEWLALSPDDVDETPCIVTIDPLGDANRLSIRQSLMEANGRGYVPREVVQRDGFGADDPRAWDKQILLDQLKTQMAGLAVQEAIMRVQMASQPQMSPLVDQNGQPMPASNPQANGGAPAAPQPPTVGAQQAQASQGSVPGLAARARGGQDSGYRPQEGVLAPV